MTSRVLQLRRAFSILAGLFLFLVLAAAAAQAQTVDVRFPRGASGTTIDGSIKGNQSVKYRIGVSAGQRMSVQLDTDNASNYFNVTAPGASEALYNSSINGNGTSFVIPSSGNYTVTVYLMRNAARRNERANYQLSVDVENAAGAPAQRAPKPKSPPPNPAPANLSTSQMSRFCAGEASASFGVRPQEITTNAAFKSGDRYVVQGYFDAADGTKFFNCWFDLDGSFQSVN